MNKKSLFAFWGVVIVLGLAVCYCLLKAVRDERNNCLETELSQIRTRIDTVDQNFAIINYQINQIYTADSTKMEVLQKVLKEEVCIKNRILENRHEIRNLKMVFLTYKDSMRMMDTIFTK